MWGLHFVKARCGNGDFVCSVRGRLVVLMLAIRPVNTIKMPFLGAFDRNRTYNCAARCNILNVAVACKISRKLAIPVHPTFFPYITTRINRAFYVQRRAIIHT